MKVFILLSIAAIAFGHDCGVNQHFTDCGTSCPLTCENYKNPPKFCYFICKIGCECDEGFVLTKDGRCVAPQQCPQEAQLLQSAPGACLREKKVGPCKGAVRKYFYNKETGKCELFYFGGCLPNENNFDTQEDCEATCKGPGACLQEKKEGPCRAAFRKYFYNKESGKCELFYYGGCQGNLNRFNTLEDCEEFCEVKPSAPSACQEEKVVGPCRAGFPRYFFNKQTGKCEQFLYGGCQGNSNNFNSQEDCEAVCLAKPSAPSACQEEKVVGPCRAAFRRYFFNKQTGKCEQFTYGGCQGNSNNFNSQEDCEAVCLA